jgi:hypothetical protein
MIEAFFVGKGTKYMRWPYYCEFSLDRSNDLSIISRVIIGLALVGSTAMSWSLAFAQSPSGTSVPPTAQIVDQAIPGRWARRVRMVVTIFQSSKMGFKRRMELVDCSIMAMAAFIPRT